MTTQQGKNIAKLLFLQTLLFSVFVGINFFILRQTSLSQIKKDLDTSITRIKNDLQYTNGKWDTSRYNADPLTAYPNASSAHPLSIVTIDGFVIERSKPIAGFLDSADFTKLLQFSQPQTVNTLSNEQWRVYAKPIIRENKTIGLAVISYYNPDQRLLAEIDKKMQDSADHIEAQVSYKNGKIDASKLDIRNLHYDVAFEIVDSSNKVVLNNGRSPDYIDRSYVADALSNTDYRTISDTQTGDTFMVKTEPITDAAGTPLALIATGLSTDSISHVLQQYLQAAAINYVVVIIPLSLILAYLGRASLTKALLIRVTPQEEIIIPSNVTFEEKTSILKVHDETIDIPQDSNQYVLLKLLFTEPEKWWTMSEIGDTLKEKDTEGALRKYYDAAIAINKKTRFKLVEYKDKSFRLHPEAV